MSELYTKAQMDEIATLIGSRVKDAVVAIPRTSIGYWAEENGGIATNAYEWSWGNGATGSDIGIPFPFDMELTAMSFNCDAFTAGSSAGVKLQRNGQLVHELAISQQNVIEILSEPINIAAGGRLDFRTGTVSGTITDARICAWLRQV